MKAFFQATDYYRCFRTFISIHFMTFCRNFIVMANIINDVNEQVNNALIQMSYKVGHFINFNKFTNFC